VRLRALVAVARAIYLAMRRAQQSDDFIWPKRVFLASPHKLSKQPSTHRLGRTFLGSEPRILPLRDPADAVAFACAPVASSPTRALAQTALWEVRQPGATGCRRPGAGLHRLSTGTAPPQLASAQPRASTPCALDSPSGPRGTRADSLS